MLFFFYRLIEYDIISEKIVDIIILKNFDESYGKNENDKNGMFLIVIVLIIIVVILSVVIIIVVIVVIYFKLR